MALCVPDFRALHCTLPKAASESQIRGPPLTTPWQPPTSTASSFKASSTLDPTSFDSLMTRVGKTALKSVAELGAVSAPAASASSVPPTGATSCVAQIRSSSAPLTGRAQPLPPTKGSAPVTGRAPTPPPKKGVGGDLPLQQTTKPNPKMVIDPSTHAWLPEDMSKYGTKAMNNAITGEPRQWYSRAHFGQGNKDGGTKQHKANRLESLLRWKNLARIHKATLPPHMEKPHIIFLTSFDDMQVAKCNAKAQRVQTHVHFNRVC